MRPEDSPQKHLGAPQVDVLHFLKQPAIDAVLARQMPEGAKVLGKTVAPETDGSVQKLTPDTRIRSYAKRHLGDVGPTASHMSAAMLMKEILVDRKAFAACLVSSTVLTLVNRIGQSSGR
jgi:hypothetical protein